MQLQAPSFPFLMLTGFWGNGGQVGGADLPCLGTEAATATQSVQNPNLCPVASLPPSNVPHTALSWSSAYPNLFCDIEQSSPVQETWEPPVSATLVRTPSNGSKR